MCLEDIRIMGRTHSTVNTVPITALTASLIVSPSMNRIGLIFAPNNLQHHTLSINPNVAIGVGLRLLTNGPEQRFDVFKHGDLCRRGWYGISDAGSTTILVFELFLDEELTRENIYGKA